MNKKIQLNSLYKQIKTLYNDDTFYIQPVSLSLTHAFVFYNQLSADFLLVDAGWDHIDYFLKEYKYDEEATNLLAIKNIIE